MRDQRPQSEAAIATMFDRIAPRYDLLNALLSMRQDKRWRNELIDRLPYRPHGRHLDVATGTGDVLLAAAEAHREYESLVGVDISREMLGLAQKKAAPLGDGRFEFRQMSAEQLTLPDAHFDALSISFGLRNVVDRAKAIQEFHRVLKPGGTLLILEFFLPRTGPGAWLFSLYFHHILPRIGGLFSDRAAYEYLPQSVGSFYSVAKLREVLYEKGFKVEAPRSFLFGACRLVQATKM